MTYGTRSSISRTLPSTLEFPATEEARSEQAMIQEQESLEQQQLDLQAVSSEPGWLLLQSKIQLLAEADRKELLRAEDPHSLAVSQGKAIVWEKLLNLHAEMLEDVQRALTQVKNNV